MEIQSVGRDITKEKENEQLLLSREKDLENKTEELERINSALEVLLERQNRKIEKYKESVSLNFTQSVLPDLEDLKRRLKISINKKTVSLIIQNINNLLAPGTSELTSPQYGLTKSEIRIATMIRNNMTSPEIADHLNISQDTVGFHRKNLRKKLGIAGSPTNLAEYLRHRL